MDELLADFLSETKEHIEGIETYLVTFEQNPTDFDAVTHIFRLAHTIKGTAGFLGLGRLQTISHAAETLIDTLRSGAPPTATAVSLLLLGMDRIKLLVGKVGELEQEPEGDDRDIIGRIEAYLQGEQDAASALTQRKRQRSQTGSCRAAQGEAASGQGKARQGRAGAQRKCRRFRCHGRSRKARANPARRS